MFQESGIRHEPERVRASHKQDNMRQKECILSCNKTTTAPSSKCRLASIYRASRPRFLMIIKDK